MQPPGGAAPEPGICPGSLVLTPVPYFPVVSADQTPAAHARLNFPQEARGGLPATRSPRREDPAVSQEGRSWRWPDGAPSGRQHACEPQQFLGEAPAPLRPRWESRFSSRETELAVSAAPNK